MNPLNKPFLFHHKTPKSQIQNKFHQFINKYNFIKSQTNPTMCKSYIHTLNFYEKAIKQVNTQIIYIYYKNILLHLDGRCRQGKNRKLELPLSN
jgi:hypothetical protein